MNDEEEDSLFTDWEFSVGKRSPSLLGAAFFAGDQMMNQGTKWEPLGSKSLVGVAAAVLEAGPRHALAEAAAF